MKIYLNGKLVEKEEAKISVFDHGLLYGDGVFEGIRAYAGKVFCLDEHLDRLYNSAQAIMLIIPLSKEKLRKAVISTLRENKLSDAYIRLVVTRGEGDLGLDPKKCPQPSIVIITDKIVLYPEEYYTQGLEVVTVATKRNLPEALNPAIKSLNYLNNILAKIEAGLRGTPEAIMLNKDGFVAECTGDNIFIIKDKEIFTPPTHIGVLEGITRNVVIKIAKEKLNFKVEENVFTQYELYTADECFLTGTAAEIIPVVKIDGRIIGEGKPGKTTCRLREEFHHLTRNSGTPIYTNAHE
ncbi:MAG TPA: branched-chain-amino-acid transaminase [Elusimicrobia bacterium]|jgi:branched-chain amino acid aminotransferase|nr:branched-chain-amino-acid transaminase [Elusimicrobiota bacterium]